MNDQEHMSAEDKREFWEFRLWSAICAYSLCIMGPIACFLVTAYCYGASPFLASVYSLGYLMFGLSVLGFNSWYSPEAKEAILWMFLIPRIRKLIRNIAQTVVKNRPRLDTHATT